MAGDKFVAVMRPFHVEATKKFTKVKSDHEQIMKDLHDLATFLNEKNDRTGAFLKTLNEFRKQFIFTMKQCEERKKREAEKAKHAKWKASRQKSIKSGSGHKSKNSKNKMALKIDENESIDDQKDDGNNNKRPPPPPGSKKKNPTIFGGNQNKSDQMLAALMRQDSSALMNKLKARRKKNSTGGGNK
eukprot:157702_1